MLKYARQLITTQNNMAYEQKHGFNQRERLDIFQCRKIIRHSSGINIAWSLMNKLDLIIVAAWPKANRTQNNRNYITWNY